MPQSVPAVIDFLLQTSGENVVTEGGEINVIPNNKLIKYRLYDVDSDNFAAFLEELFTLKMLRFSFSEQLTPEVEGIIGSEVDTLIENYIVAATGTSSQHGKLLKAILNDAQATFTYYKDLTKGKKGFKDHIPSFQGRDDGMEPVEAPQR